MIQSNIEFLREYTEKKNNKKVKHEFSKYARFFPYTANDSRATFEQGMERVIGEMVRQLSSVELSKSYNTDEIMNNLLEKITFEVDEIKPNFKEIFKNFIGADENRARIFHPYMYHFITLSENGEALREKELAEFIKCIFFEDLNAKHCFEKSKANNVFIQLLLDSMGDLIGKNYEEQYAADSETEFSKTSKKKAYKSKLPFLTEIFKNDFEYLATKKDGFIKELPLIISYYYFMYVCQLSMKLDQGFKAD
jgi:DNA phosphorothioation-dependent restriction protein DptG